MCNESLSTLHCPSYCIRFSSLEVPLTTSALPPSPSSDSSITAPLVTTSITGSTSKSQEPMPSPSSRRLPSTSCSGVPSSWVSSSPTSVSSTAILFPSSEIRSRMICSLHARDHGRCGLLCTWSTSSSSPTSGAFHTSTLSRLRSTCSYLFLDLRRHKYSYRIYFLANSVRLWFEIEIDDLSLRIISLFGCELRGRSFFCAHFQRWRYTAMWLRIDDGPCINK